jgi:hypothetical protein
VDTTQFVMKFSGTEMGTSIDNALHENPWYVIREYAFYWFAQYPTNESKKQAQIIWRDM